MQGERRTSTQDAGIERLKRSRTSTGAANAAFIPLPSRHPQRIIVLSRTFSCEQCGAVPELEGRNLSERVDLLEGLLKAVNRGLFGLAKDVLHRHAIPASGMAIMGQIVKIPGTTVSELARQTGFAKSHVSGTVESLSDLGFVDKRPDPRDQRLARVYPTQRAEEHFRQMQAAVRERLSSMISILPEEKVDAIIDGLQTLKAALEQERHIGDDRL